MTSALRRSASICKLNSKSIVIAALGELADARRQHADQRQVSRRPWRTRGPRPSNPSSLSGERSGRKSDDAIKHSLRHFRRSGSGRLGLRVGIEEDAGSRASAASVKPAPGARAAAPIAEEEQHR
jgi:hypothetical protein